MRLDGSHLAGRQKTCIAPAWQWSGVEIHHCGLDESVPELFFDSEDMSATDEHVGDEGMTEQDRAAVGQATFVRTSQGSAQTGRFNETQRNS